MNFQQALIDGDPIQWMLDLISGRDSRPWIMDQICLGVVLTIPYYPYSHATKKEVVGVPVYGITPKIAPNIHALHVMRGTAPATVQGKIINVPAYVTAGDYVLAATGVAETIRAAKDMAYRILRRLHLPNSPQYRTDIGDRLKTQLPKCQAHGYATGMVWDSPSS